MLSTADFNRIRELIYGLCWIDLNDSKKELVKARLAKRLRALNLDSYSTYVDFVMEDKTGLELSVMVDILTTNFTSFFRGQEHFDYLRNSILPSLPSEGQKKIRLWSAGCSSGEEPYSMAITCAETFQNIWSMDVSILGTDISSKVIDFAKEGIYDQERLNPIQPLTRQKYFIQIDRKKGFYQIKNTVKKLVHFRKHNLAGAWPMKGPFDVIFCRNVMIYFSKAAKVSLLDRFYKILNAQGALFIGHSESLKELTEQFVYVAPGIYKKL